MSSLTLQDVVFRVISILVIVAIHGFSASGIAALLGDPGPRQDGRLTLNPVVHVDAIGAVALIVSGYGWSRPIALSPSALRWPLIGVLAVTIGSALAVALLAFIVALFRPAVAVGLSATGAPIANALIASFVQSSLGFALLNLVPVPPLGGGYVLDRLWPKAAQMLRRNVLIVSIVLLALAVGGFPARWLGGPVHQAAQAILGRVLL